MFGIIGMLIGGAIAAGESIQRSIETSEKRQYAIDTGEVTYYGKGGLRLARTGEKIRTHGNHIYDEYGNYLTSFSEERERIAKENPEAVEYGKLERAKFASRGEEYYRHVLEYVNCNFRTDEPYILREYAIIGWVTELGITRNMTKVRRYKHRIYDLNKFRKVYDTPQMKEWITKRNEGNFHPTDEEVENMIEFLSNYGMAKRGYYMGEEIETKINKYGYPLFKRRVFLSKDEPFEFDFNEEKYL